MLLYNTHTYIISYINRDYIIWILLHEQQAKFPYSIKLAVGCGKICELGVALSPMNGRGLPC